MSERPTVLEWLYHWEKTTPDRLWFTQPMGGGDANLKTWTVAQAMDEARRMASHLTGLGLPEKSSIALCSKNCAYWIIADLAIMMAGHVSVPLYPILTADTVSYVLEHSGAKLLFVGKLDPVWDKMKEGVPADMPTIAFPLAPDNDCEQWDAIIAKSEPLSEPVTRDPEELCTIIYTSGSTGRPKGVMLSFGAMVTSAEGIKKALGIKDSDRMLSYLPLAHAMERWLVECQSAVTGMHIFFAESLDTFVADLRRARPTLFLSVPRLWLKFQQGVFKKMPPWKLNLLTRIPILGGKIKRKVLQGLGLDEVRFAGSGSAPIPADLIAWYRHMGLELLEGYGMSENFSYSHVNQPGKVRVGYVGSPYPDCECKISEEGEILVKSPGTMMGYYKNEEATKESFTADGFLKTGDRGEIDAQGRLRITGRIKELFKTSKGKYVAPAPIENLILTHQHIEMCCVGGSGQPQPHALVQLSEDTRKALQSGNGSKDEVEAALKEHLSAINSELAAYEKLEFLCVVKDVWMTENGFLTPTMKIRRAAIEDAYGSYTEGWYAEKKKVVWQS